MNRHNFYGLQFVSTASQGVKSGPVWVANGNGLPVFLRFRDEFAQLAAYFFSVLVIVEKNIATVSLHAHFFCLVKPFCFAGSIRVNKKETLLFNFGKHPMHSRAVCGEL